jgi:META domain
VTTPLQPDELRALLDDVAAGAPTVTFDEIYRKAHRQRQVWRTGLVAAVVAVVAAAIAVPAVLVSHNGTPQVLTASPQPTVSTGHANPLALVGRWKVSAAGERPGTSLILGDQLSLFRPCGLLDGEWRADPDGLFIGDVDGGDGACFHTTQALSVPWLDAAVGYRVEGPDRVLLNAAGDIVARLSPGAHPTTGPNDAPSFAAPPKLTAALRAALRAPAPLSGGLQPVSPTDILGRWRPAKASPHSPEPPFVAFASTGTWTGSDGCNSYGGRFAVGSAGGVLTTSGASTAVGCAGSQAPIWVQNVGRAAIDGNQLVLFDSRGKLLGRLTRKP